MRRTWLIVPIGLLGIIVFAYIGGEIVRLLWNWLLPPLFGFPELTFWQALGLLALSRILVGGWHGGGRYRSDPSFRRRFADRMTDRMVDRFADRWDRMTPEERDRLRQRMRERFGFDPAGGDNTAAT